MTTTDINATIREITKDHPYRPADFIAMEYAWLVRSARDNAERNLRRDLRSADGWRDWLRSLDQETQRRIIVENYDFPDIFERSAT